MKSATDTEQDNFIAFISARPTSLRNLTPLEWWCTPESRLSYPRLSQMAIAILLIPAESAEPERTFSGARRTCSSDRLRLTCSRIEQIECLGSWLREGHIKPGYLAVTSLAEEEADDTTPDNEDELADLLYSL